MLLFLAGCLVNSTRLGSDRFNVGNFILWEPRSLLLKNPRSNWRFVSKWALILTVRYEVAPVEYCVRRDWRTKDALLVSRTRRAVWRPTLIYPEVTDTMCSTIVSVKRNDNFINQTVEEWCDRQNWFNVLAFVKQKHGNILKTTKVKPCRSIKYLNEALTFKNVASVDKMVTSFENAIKTCCCKLNTKTFNMYPVKIGNYLCFQ